MRWSHAVRTAEWLATEYNNQSAPWAFATAGETEPAPEAQASAPVLVYQQADDVAASVGGVEAIDKRTSNARHFRNSDGSWTAVIANNLNAPDQTGKLVPVLRQLWQTSRWHSRRRDRRRRGSLRSAGENRFLAA